jgi:hypothetical protein
MSKVHEDNAGYIGVSHEETQDPYFSYNKLSLPLSESDKTVIRNEETFTVAVAGGKFVVNGVSQASLSLAEGGVYTFDLSDSSVGSHPFRIRKNPDTSANSLTNGLPTGYSATSSQYTGTLSSIETDDANYIQAVGSHVNFDLGAVKKIHKFIAKWTSYVDDSSSADYRIALYSDSSFTTLLAASPSAESENTSDVVTVDHDFGGIEAQYVRWEYVGGGRVGRLRYFYPYVDTTDVTLTTSGTQGQPGATAKYVVPFGSGPLAYYCASHSGMGADVATPANTFMFDGALPILKTTDAFGATTSALNFNGNDIGVERSTTENIGAGSLAVINTSDAQLTYYSSTAQYHSLKVNFATPIANATGVKFRGGGYAAYAQYELRINGELIGGTRTTIIGWGVETVTFSSRTVSSISVTSVGNGYGFALGDVQFQVGGSYSHPSGTVGLASYDTAKDPYAASLVLAIPMNGENGGRTFTDVSYAIRGSGATKTINKSGDTKTSTAQSKYYGSSGAFDGSNDNLKLPANADFQFGSGDFTIETWFKPNNTNRMAIYHGSSGTDHSLGIDYSYITQTIAIWASSNGTSWNLADGDSSGNRGSIVVPVGAWTHIAFVRNGGSLQLYVNGVLDKQFSTTASIVDESSYQPVIGEWFNGIYDLNGYLADFRIYKGVAKYTSNFVLPDQIDLQDRSGNDNNASNSGATWQTSVKKFYGGAAEFNGDADENAASRLSVSDGLTFNSDFTIEFWAYPSTSPDYSVLFDCWQNQTSGTGFYLWTRSNGAVDILKDANTYYLQSFMSAGSLAVNVWNHIAIVRSGNVVTGYSNGSPRGNYTVSDNWTSTKGMIGSGIGNGTMKGFAGYLQDFKHYGGIAKYSSSFSPPERSVQGTARRYPSGIYVVS